MWRLLEKANIDDDNISVCFYEYLTLCLLVLDIKPIFPCLQREGAARSDAERERRARGDWEARARVAEADAARLAAKLHAAQREITR